MKNQEMNYSDLKKDNKIFWGIVIFVSIFAGILSFLSINFALALIFALFLIILSTKKIELGIYFLILYIPFEPFLLKFSSDELYPFLKYGTEVIIFLLLIITLAKFWQADPSAEESPDHPVEKKRKRFRYIKTPIDIPLLIFIFITAVSALLNLENPFFWLLGLRQILRYVVLFYIIVYSGIHGNVIKKIVVLLMVLLTIESAIGFSQALIGKRADEFFLPGEKREFASIVSPDYVYQFWSSGQRIFATMGRYDRLGTFMCLVIILALGLFYEAKSGKEKKILLSVVFFSLPTLVLTYSRLSWIGLLIALLFINLIIKKNKKFLVGVIIFSILLTGYLFLYIEANHLRIYTIIDKPQMSVASKLLSTFSLKKLKLSYNGYGRLYFAINTPQKVVKKYPLFGVGLGQFGSGVAYSLNNTTKYDELGLPFGVGGTEGQIDNNWFSLWGETGTLGVMAFMAVILSLFFYTLTFYKESEDPFDRGLALAFLGIALAVSFQALLGPYFEIRTLSFNFWLLAGIIVSLGLKEKSSFKESKNVKPLKLDFSYDQH